MYKILSHIRTTERCSKHFLDGEMEKNRRKTNLGGSEGIYSAVRARETTRQIGDKTNDEEALILLKTRSVNHHTLSVTFLHTHAQTHMRTHAHLLINLNEDKLM